MTAPSTAAAVIRHQAGLDVLAWPVLDALDGVDALVTTRRGGVSGGPYESLNLSQRVADPADVLENRRRAARALGADLGDLVFCAQMHGAEARVVTAADRGRGALSGADAIPAADALVTADPGVAIALLAADCLPIVLYDPVAHVLACVHAGWRGTVARVAESAVTAMRTLGTRPQDVIACFGPAISADSYQVGSEVIQAAERALGDSARSAYRPDGAGRWLFDLPTANQIVLGQAGVHDVHLPGFVTGPDPGSVSGPGSRSVSGPGSLTDQSRGLFFSHRQAAPCGRFAALARLSARGTR
jgi:polyphenol oxidase